MRQRPSRKLAHKLRRRPPYFRPVPLRTRHDGWNEIRQGHFLAALYITGSVGLAAGAVGMSRVSAYNLRKRRGGEDFAFAWDAVLMPPGTGRLIRPKAQWRKLTIPELFGCIETGLIQPAIYRGQVTSVRRKPDNSALFRLLKRVDALAANERASL